MRKTVIGALMLALAMAPAAGLAKDGGKGEGRENAPGQVKKNPFQNIPVKSADGSFAGTFNIIGFATSNAADGTPTGIDAIGLLSGTLRGQQVTNQLIRWPLAPSAMASGIAPQQAVSCDILNLVLGPLHLNLLGLVVDLNQVVLNITGATGAGNLLGNLLCGLFGILDVGGTIAAVGQLVQNLNNILAILGTL
jgi:hypothetical protein